MNNSTKIAFIITTIIFRKNIFNLNIFEYILKYKHLKYTLKVIFDFTLKLSKAVAFKVIS